LWPLPRRCRSRQDGARRPRGRPSAAGSSAVPGEARAPSTAIRSHRGPCFAEAARDQEFWRGRCHARSPRAALRKQSGTSATHGTDHGRPAPGSNERMNEFASAVPGPRVRSAILLGGLACAAAVLSLLGWILDLPRLAAWEGTIAMQPNTAIAGAAAGLALVLLAVHRRRGAIIAGGFAAVLGGLSLVQNLAGFDLGTDALVSFERPWGEDGTVAPGSRMSPPAALSWVLLGTGIVLGALPARAARRAAPWLALGAVAIASLSIVGRLFGADPL